MDSSPPPVRDKDISSQWLLALVESALDGVITMDDKGRIIAFNPAAENIFGYSKDQVIGRRVSAMIVPEPNRKGHDQGLANYLKTGMEKMIGRRVEVSAMRADQTIFPAEMEVLSVQDETPAVFMAYIRDISKQKQAEQEQRKYALNIKKTLVQTILAISRRIEIRSAITVRISA